MKLKDNIFEYNEADVPELTSLWTRIFGDPLELAERFFELLPSMGTGFVGKVDGRVVGMAFLIDAFLSVPNAATKRLSYIYAVGVDKAMRGQGFGSELTRACLRRSVEGSADVCCTLPAEMSLYGWYESNFGLETASRCTYDRISPGEPIDGIVRLNADEYSFMREALLKEQPHVSLYYGYMLFQETVFDCSEAGGFFCRGNSLACGYVENGTLYVKEALGDRPDFLPALCTYLGAENAVVRRPSLYGERYIAALRKRDFPPETVWNLTLD